MSARKTVVFAVLTVSLCGCISLLIAEFAVRVFWPPSAWKLPERLYDVDPDLGWAYKRNAHSTGVIGDKGHQIDLRTNDDGVTPVDSLRQRQPGLMRIMLFGDSGVIGRGVPDSERVHRHLQRVLGERGIQAEVINAAVEGYATDQSLLMMKKLMPLYKPDVALYGLCSNDIDGNLERVAHGMPKPIFWLTRSGSLTLESPNPELVDYIRNIMRSTSKPPLLQRSAVYQILRPATRQVRSWLQHLRGIDDPPDLWVTRMFFDEQVLQQMGTQMELLEALLKEMRITATANGARFLLYSHPSLEETWDPRIKDLERRYQLKPGSYNRWAFEATMKKLGSEAGVTYCPAVAHFVRNQSQGPFHLLPDPHCNAVGYRLTAEVLNDCVIRLILK